ncbi:MAG: S-layer homology domain-containing protein [Actinobacteria bacterium]|nr:S-layer homology domain-containing protein [Actinomycetota bacterium]
MRTVRAVLVTALALGALPATAAGAAAAGEPPASPCAEVPVAPYVDVDRASPHAGAIDCGLWIGLVRGTEPDVFLPGAAVRRDQMAVLVARAVTASRGELPAPERRRFSDLEGNVHRDAIESLAAAGIVTGYADGTYRPRGTVPRGQMTAFLARAWEHLAGEELGEAPDAFADDDGHAHEPTIDRLAARGLVSGRTATTFAPDDATTRAGTAAFLLRLVGDHWGDRARTVGAFTSRVEPLPARLRARMTGGSWRPGCPVGLDDLRLLSVVHRGMDGRDRWGLLVLHRDGVADEVALALREAHAEGFAIERMQLVDRFGADDDASMAANNTSAFNCRYVEGTSRWSRHAYGDAVDVNPVQNPYVRGSEVEPSAGRAYLDRDDVRPGMIVRPNALLRALEGAGWGWGGDWSASKDYQHLSRTGS